MGPLLNARQSTYGDLTADVGKRKERLARLIRELEGRHRDALTDRWD